MLTARLWRRLFRTSPADPVFTRALHGGNLRARSNRSPLADTVLGVSVVVFCTLSAFYPPLLLAAPLVVGSTFGVYWAAAVAGMVAQEQQRRVLPLLSLLPGGPRAACESLALAAMHRADLLGVLQVVLLVIRLVSATALFVVLAAVLTFMGDRGLGPVSRPLLWRELGSLSVVFAASCALYADQVQSTVWGWLVGLAAPLGTGRSGGEARGIAVLLFVGGQVLVYVVTLGVGFGVLPAVLTLWVEEMVVRVVLPLLQLLLFVALREVLIVVVWRWLLHHWGEPPPVPGAARA